MERLDVVLENEGVRISHAYVAHVQYEKEPHGPRKWVRVMRNDGTDLIFPIRTWDDVQVSEISTEYFAISIKVDWNGSVLQVGI
jgi:hypothetical protein